MARKPPWQVSFQTFDGTEVFRTLLYPTRKAALESVAGYRRTNPALMRTYSYAMKIAQA